MSELRSLAGFGVLHYKTVGGKYLRLCDNCGWEIKSTMRSTVFIPTYEKFNRERKPRMLGVACYFGLTPILCAAGVEKQRNRYLNYHIQHSLIVSLLFFWFLVTLLIVYVALAIESSHETTVISLGFVRILDYINTGLLFIWLTVGGISIFSAWTGRTPHLLILSNITHHKKWMRFALVWTIVMQAGLTLLVIISLHGAFLSRETSNPPKAYILYTQGGYIPLPQLYETYTPPRWTISLFFYPIVLTANFHWGSGSVAIQPLSDVSFREAIHNGRFVFVASHGGMEPGSFTYSYLPYKGFLPSDVMPGDTGAKLRYVYFAACDAGLLGTYWENALYPAQVKSFDRISYVHEHFLWAWFKGAKVISSIE